MMYRVGQKSKPDNFCNNFVYCLSANFHNFFGTDRKFATAGYIVSPPNMVYVTTLHCKI